VASVVSAWCAGCHLPVAARAWNQDTYLCTTCTDRVHLLIRRWASDKVLQRWPIDTIIHQEVSHAAR
jgi:hypothetical protein